VRKKITFLLAVLAATALLAGCVSMPSGGPVQPYTITQGQGAQGAQSYPQIIPVAPGAGWNPTQIVRGFLTASASFADGQQVAREYLTQAVSDNWRPSWSAAVFKGGGPEVGNWVYPEPGKRDQATVVVSGALQARLSSTGTYAVPSASGPQDMQPITFHLVKTGDQWRIASAPPQQLLLTSLEFTSDYQLRNLYFVDPKMQFLVPDPVYVPLQATPTNLMNDLVGDLNNPPSNWLADGTGTAFPTGTKLLGDVSVDGTLATVDLGGAIAKANDLVREQVSAQLLATLSGTAPGQPSVQSIALFVNNKPWFPPTAPGTVVQHSYSVLTIPTGANDAFYYLDSHGEVLQQSGSGGPPVSKQKIGPGFSAIAVSPDGRYLAAIKDGSLFTGPLGGTLVKRQGSGYTTMSWDTNDNIWATADGDLYMLTGNATQRSAQTAQDAPEVVNVVQLGGGAEAQPIGAVRIAPDGVRVALIIGTGTDTSLAFGAIATQTPDPTRPGEPGLLQIMLSPFYVLGGTTSFSQVTWYGPDNVITLGTASGAQGPLLTEYPVNGGSSTTISNDPDITSITTSQGSELIAGAKGGLLLADASTSGVWASVGRGAAPAYPG
jgi:Lipoprotein LpqB beta-propeller domain/Sporulation and spore germination